jgi:hypothetical protein
LREIILFQLQNGASTRLQITDALVAGILVAALPTGQTRADVIFDNLNNGIFDSGNAPDPGQIIYSPGSSIPATATQAESDDQGQTWFLRFQGTNVGLTAFRHRKLRQPKFPEVEGTNVDAPEPSALALTIIAALPFATLVLPSIGRKRSG